MTAYVLVEAEVHDYDRADEYRVLAEESIRRHGGRYLIQGTVPEAVEGAWPNPSRVTTVVEFPDLAALREWYDSDEYQAAKAVREGAIDVRLLVAPGKSA
ncbi:DUF1330 domain-containing protein [Saccharopolyspora taberi]|uniref:DUF1330 domain-containing protein n=1 Tax=Saccharopolyspora taberi TaxID=60895 RepID=A0ABN3V2B5_9PSEU